MKRPRSTVRSRALRDVALRRILDGSGKSGSDLLGGPR